MNRDKAIEIASHAARKSPGSTGLDGAEGSVGRVVGEYLIDELRQLPDPESWSGNTALGKGGDSGEVTCGLTNDVGLFVVNLEFQVSEGNAIAALKGQMSFAPFGHSEWTLIRDSAGEGFPDVGSHVRLEKRVAWQVMRNGQRALEVIADGEGSDSTVRVLARRFGWDM